MKLGRRVTGESQIIKMSEIMTWSCDFFADIMKLGKVLTYTAILVK